MFSQNMSGTSQSLDVMGSTMDIIKQDMNKLYDIYVRECNGKMTKKQIIEELKHDKWWNADKCIKKGLCDEILKNLLV